MKSNRRWYSMLPRSGIQFRLFIPLLCAIFAFDTIFANLILYILRELATSLPDQTALQMAVLDDLRRRTLYYTAVALLVPGVLSVFLMAFATHRVIGPLVNIRRFVRGLIDGNSTGELRLRRDDELSDLAGDLNELATKMHASR